MADWAIAHGDALSVLSLLPSGIAQTCVTSPPYFGLRSYGNEPVAWPAVSYAPMPGLPELTVAEWTGNLGLEPTPEMFIAHLVLIFREVKRVLADTGVVWINMGDSYAGSWGNYSPTGQGGQRDKSMERWQRPAYEDKQDWRPPTSNKLPGLKPKDLMLIPARLALALQADGWWVRSEIVWAKGRSLHVDECGPGSTMPESVGDRPTKAHEMVYLLSKSGRYFYDAEAVREPSVSETQLEHNLKYAKQYDAYDSTAHNRQPNNTNHKGIHSRPGSIGRNLRDVWLINPGSFKQAHFAVFPDDIPDICIRAGTSERGQCPHCGAPWERVVERTPMEIKRSGRAEEMGEFGRTQASGTMTKPPTSETVGWQPTCECDEHEPVAQLVIDPFSGAGTTGLVATRLGRRYIGIEPNAEYVKMSEQRIINDAPLFNLPAKAGVIEAA